MQKRTTGSDIDATLYELVTAYNAAFPNHGLSYYLIGSWADGDSNALSDIDVVIVWTRGAPTEDDRVRGEYVAVSLTPPIWLDVFMVAEADVPASLVGVNVRVSSRHLSGPDIRQRLPLNGDSGVLEVHSAFRAVWYGELDQT